jgi:hypothetical protein
LGYRFDVWLMPSLEGLMGKAMLILAAAIGLAAAGFGSGVASAGMLGVSDAVPAATAKVDVATEVFYRCQRIRVCDPGGCWIKRTCWRNCPDGISCYPLYGAYGPYGGIGYWGAYTFTGWGPAGPPWR